MSRRKTCAVAPFAAGSRFGDRLMNATRLPSALIVAASGDSEPAAPVGAGRAGHQHDLTGEGVAPIDLRDRDRRPGQGRAMPVSST